MAKKNSFKFFLNAANIKKKLSQNLNFFFRFNRFFSEIVIFQRLQKGCIRELQGPLQCEISGYLIVEFSENYTVLFFRLLDFFYFH